MGITPRITRLEADNKSDFIPTTASRPLSLSPARRSHPGLSRKRPIGAAIDRRGMRMSSRRIKKKDIETVYRGKNKAEEGWKGKARAGSGKAT